MGCRGVFFALDDNDSKLLLSASGDEEVMDIVQEQIEERWDQEWLCETDKAWDAMHRCLSDGTLDIRVQTPLAKCVVGGRPLYYGGDYVVSYVSPQDVRVVARALERVDKPWFRKKYFRLRKKFLWFDFTEYAGPICEDDFDYTWESFEDTRAFYKKAALAGRAVIFTVDQ